MRNSGQQRTPCSRPFTLIETLAYAGLLILTVGLGTQFFLGALQSSRDVRLAGEDILRSSEFGDQWRRDLRSGQLQTGNGNASDERLCSIALPDGGSVVYRQRQGRLLRQGPDGQISRLNRVKQANLRQIHTGPATWRLDLELAARNEPARIRPQFSFIAAERGQEP